MARGRARPAFRKPLEAHAVDGEVAITGPGHLSGSMTPAAAEESGRRMMRKAREAARQPPRPDNEP